MTQQKSSLEKRPIPKYLRIIVPLVLVVIWFAVAGIGGPYFGKISEVASNDQSTFLPASAESTQVAEELRNFQDESSLPTVIVFSNNTQPLDPAAIGRINGVTRQLTKLEGISGNISPAIPSQDKKAAIVVLAMESGYSYKEFTAAINQKLTDAKLGLDFAVTGPVGFLNDLGRAFAGIDGILLLVALSVVFVILIIVYRSPILPFLVLATSLFALCAAILVVYYLAKAGIVTLNGQVQGILFILVIGAATDYALLFVARYREELKNHREPYRALIAGWRHSLEPITAAGGTVIAGLLCLLLSDLNSNKALGPVGAIGICLAIISALTLLPSLLLVWGRKVFWPRIPHYTNRQKTVGTARTQPGLWNNIGTFVATHSRSIWISTTLVLCLCSLGLLQLKADGVSQSEYVLGASQARSGQAMIDAHFPGGSGTPTFVIVPADLVAEAATILEKSDGVASVAARADNSPSGTVPLGRAAQNSPFKNATIKEVNNEALLEVTLQAAADSETAQATIEKIRGDLHTLSTGIRVGGTTAVQLDTRVTAGRDRSVVIPSVLIVITIILMLLLRSILAPIILLATTMLSFAATLGISALVFNHLLGFPGADPTVVLYGFIFLVALGIDYNIFLMTRVREESLKKGTRKGVIIGLIVTGGVISSAGVVLASTFAALAVIPILFLVQLAFVVAFGVLLDTIVVRSLLVPALTRDIGAKIWWPSKKHID